MTQSFGTIWGPYLSRSISVFIRQFCILQEAFFLWGHVQNSSHRLLSVGLLYKILILSAIYFQNILYKRPTVCKRRELCDYLDRVILHTSSPFLLPVAEMSVFALRTSARNVVCKLGHHHLKMMKSKCNCLFSHF